MQITLREGVTNIVSWEILPKKEGAHPKRKLTLRVLGSVLFPLMKMRFSVDTTGRYIQMGLMRSWLKAV